MCRDFWHAGAGYADFVKILNERWGGIQVRVAHTQVQGLPASDQIIRALEFLRIPKEDLPDVIAIIRGGGSADDLAVFNDEKLVRAVTSSRVPIIWNCARNRRNFGGFGGGFTASTPSNVAQILTPEKSREIAFLRSKITRTGENILSKLKKKAFEAGKISKIAAKFFEKSKKNAVKFRRKFRF